jgi:RNA methyltransferase, TrmH family
MYERITSLQNPRIKQILKLQKAAERKEQNLCTIEGVKEFQHAVESGLKVQQFFFCPEIVSDQVSSFIHALKLPASQVFEISRPVFERIAYRDSTEGIYALVTPRQLQLKDIKLRKQPLVLILESVEKPGNLGALLRTADAAALDAVIICDPHTDLFNPNVIRSSIGAIFTQQVSTCTSAEAINWIKMKGIRSFAASLGGKKFYHQVDFTAPSALVMGTESTGLSDQWLMACNEQILIPMLGKMDSLNVSTSAAILLFEAMRQRGYKV